LCVEDIGTGNSITTKISFKKRLFPKVKFTDEELHVLLPRWSAVLVVAGALVFGGMIAYEKYLDIRLKQMQLDEQTQRAVSEVSERLREMHRTNEPEIFEIEQSVQKFRSVAFQTNIVQVTLNDEVIKSE
jgi:hypothetical protein